MTRRIPHCFLASGKLYGPVMQSPTVALTFLVLPLQILIIGSDGGELLQSQAQFSVEALEETV